MRLLKDLPRLNDVRLVTGFCARGSESHRDREHDELATHRSHRRERLGCHLSFCETRPRNWEEWYIVEGAVQAPGSVLPLEGRQHHLRRAVLVLREDGRSVHTQCWNEDGDACAQHAKHRADHVLHEGAVVSPLLQCVVRHSPPAPTVLLGFALPQQLKDAEQPCAFVAGVLVLDRHE